jgi:6,7-dimethyl-8-ribityllumazine synthase
MSTKNLSDYKAKNLPDISAKKFGIVVAEWNEEITNNLLQGTIDTLVKHGAKYENLVVKTVPGSYELILGSTHLAKRSKIDAVIALGCIIQGETRHFEFIANAVANGIIDVNLRHTKPVVFGVLTTDTLEQAKDRSGGKLGNKGDEAAITAIKMVGFTE